ncbi:hypothetical protein BU16DRAFT_317509 [Lophium mytilinum]|uniref:RRM domain-containing protein n=1 Tax=Lophium mytilinum TaxID=390894 RepID=A0A6A6QYM5_9PEZI|nr:hypothetical protein BU16DRAFT_317509 [Lophium mytilinum]
MTRLTQAGHSFSATSNDDVIGLTKKDVEQVQGKVAAHLDSLSEGKHKPFTKAEIDESAQRIRTELIARPAAFYKSDQFRKAMVTAIADYLNSLDCNPGQPITAALIQNVLTSNGRNYLNLCARLVSLGVMGASEDEIFNLNNAIQAAEDKLWLTRKDATSTRETSTENGSSPKINMTNLSTKAQPDVDTQPKIDTKPVVPTQPTISTKPVVQTKPTVGAQPSTPVKAALRGETSASAAPSGIWTPKQDIAPANMAAWPSQQKRENRAQHRRAILKGIPSDWKLDQVQAHIWGGRIERIERTADSSTAWVKFMTMEGYNKYFADTANGIEVAGSTRLILAEPDEGPNSTNDLLSSMVESGVTRCVRALDAEEDWSMPTLTRIARGKDRKLDKIKIGKEKGRNFVEFRFSSVYEALVFKKELMDDEDWEPTTIVYAPDPCDVHSGIHLDD